QQDSWDIWDNHMPIHAKNGLIIGYKYFGFGGLAKDQFGLKAFKGTKKGNNTAFNLFLVPKSNKSFKVNVWLDGPWANATWKGTKIGDRKSTRLNSSHVKTSYAVFCLKNKTMD